MSKEKLMEAYRKTEIEWSQLGLREKAKKIKAFLKSLKLNTFDEQQYINNQILMIEELEPSELSNLLDNIHSVIMENNKKIINSMKV